MAYLTENQLTNTLDLPIALPATDLRMGDWVIVASVKIVAPMTLTYRVANLQMNAATIDPALVTAGNKIYGNLGLAYLTLRKDYVSGSPGVAGGLDALVSNGLGITSRSTSTSVVITADGVYTWIIANNMQPSTDTVPLIPVSTSIDFRVAITGSVRLIIDAS
jgi:hypothetical protein